MRDGYWATSPGSSAFWSVIRAGLLTGSLASIAACAAHGGGDASGGSGSGSGPDG